MSQKIFTKTLFSIESPVIHGQMLVQGKRGLSQLDKKIIGLLLIAILAIVLLSVLFAPIIPVQVTTTKTRTMKLLSYYKTQSVNDDSRYPDYVNVTNYDTVG